MTMQSTTHHRWRANEDIDTHVLSDYCLACGVRRSLPDWAPGAEKSNRLAEGFCPAGDPELVALAERKALAAFEPPTWPPDITTGRTLAGREFRWWLRYWAEHPDSVPTTGGKP